MDGRAAQPETDANDPLRTSDVQCNRLSGCRTAGVPADCLDRLTGPGTARRSSRSGAVAWAFQVLVEAENTKINVHREL